MQLSITLQFLYRFRPICLRPHVGNILPPTGSQRALKKLLKSIRKPNIAHSHPLHLLVFILYARIWPSSSDVRPCADEDGVLTLNHIRLCVVLKGVSNIERRIVYPVGTMELDGTKTHVHFLLVPAEICQKLFQPVRTRKLEPLAQDSNAVPVRQNRRKPPSSRIQWLHILFNVVCANGRRCAFWSWGRCWKSSDRRDLASGGCISSAAVYFILGCPFGSCGGITSNKPLGTREGTRWRANWAGL